jgi:hypothetical protein
VALSSWSRPIGRTSRGVSAARALIAVPWPPCVTTTDACSSTARCGAERSTWTCGCDGSSSGSIAWPVVTTPRTGSAPRASTMRRRSASWSMFAVLREARTTGWSPAGGCHSSAHAGSSKRGPT